MAEKSGRPVLTGDWPRRSGRGENHLHFAVTAAVESSEQPLPSGWSDADYIVTLLTTSSRCTAAKNAGVDWTVDRWTGGACHKLGNQSESKTSIFHTSLGARDLVKAI